MTEIINCEVHDHFEIACMRRALVEVQFKNGETISGRAIDLQSKDGKEYFTMEVERGKYECNLKDLSTLTFIDSGKSINVF